MSDTSDRPANRLLQETSPYLRQHAFNPVDWYPWGNEALQASRAGQRPIFLSIGYSACHWCHVMERESFENDAIAELMNRFFVNIKVDREERPELDRIYMNSVLAITRRGGWPMSVFLTPDCKPFYGGTYWPPESRMGMPGFADILQKVAHAWESQRDQILGNADELTEAVINMSAVPRREGSPDETLLKRAMHNLLNAADRTEGGFGAAPKFPHPMDLRLLLRCARRFDNDDARAVVRLTLDKMGNGGIYDHLGGGFHRYSTDARWLVPHFEKMLYDNALLVPAYLESAQWTGNAEHAGIARETLDSILREMTQPGGGFYSTQDADSEGVEGKFFVWSEAEIAEILGPDDAILFNTCYDVTAAGNWEGTNILNRTVPHQQRAKNLGIAEDDLRERLRHSREKLLAVRNRRIAPARDEKVIVSWNGMMIAAMSRGARVLNDSRFADAARDAADFLWENLQSDDGRLQHVFKDGRSRFNGYLDDYACLIDGFTELYQAVFETKYLDAAILLAERMCDRFRDAEEGGFFFTSDDHETLIARHKDAADDATPSGNAMAVTALLKLARLTGKTHWESIAVETLELLCGHLSQQPMAAGQALLAVDFLLGPAQEFVVAEGEDAAENAIVHSRINACFLPGAVVLVRPSGLDDSQLPLAVSNLIAGRTVRENRTTLYLCSGQTCSEPVTGSEECERLLGELV